MSGTVLAKRYEVGELLGSGGFGATYRARDLARFNAPCVVKELLPGRRSNDVARRLFEREARLLFELHHPQIPTLHAYFEEEGRFYLVQDFVEGQTLSQRLRRDTRLSESEVVSIVDSLLGVLEYLHGREPPVIHRDIKPANVIVGNDGMVYLIDFGAVREAIGADDQQTAIGTPGYTPREQAVGRPRPSSDLYALGATALEMISGQHPLEWHDRSTGQLDWRGRLNCSASLEETLAGMLAEVPSRFPSATEARAALRGGRGTPASVQVAPVSEAASDVAVPPPAGPVDDSPAPVVSSASNAVGTPSGSTGPWLLPVLSGAAALLVLVWFLGRGKEERPTPTSAIAPAALSQDSVANSVPKSGPAPEPAVPAAPQQSPGDAAVRAPLPAATRDTATTAVARDTNPVSSPQRDSMAIECARLLERVSLGEALTEREATRLSRFCKRGSP